MTTAETLADGSGAGPAQGNAPQVPLPPDANVPTNPPTEATTEQHGEPATGANTKAEAGTGIDAPTGGPRDPRAAAAFAILLLLLGMAWFLAERSYRRGQELENLGNQIRIPLTDIENYLPRVPRDRDLTFLESAMVDGSALPRDVDDYVRFSTEAHEEAPRFERVKSLLAENPGSPHLLLAEARFRMKSRDFEGSQAVLQQVLNKRPDWTVVSKDLVVALLRQGKYDEAIAQGTAGVDTARNVGDTEAEADILGNLVWCYLVQKDLNRAVHAQLRAKELHEQLGHARSLVIDQVGLAHVVAARGQYDDALQHFAQAEMMAQRLNDQGLLARVYAAWALFHQQRGEFMPMRPLLERLSRMYSEDRVRDLLQERPEAP